MLRWTIRAFGGRGSDPSLSCFFCTQTLRLSRSRFNCTVPLVDSAEDPSCPTGPRNALHSSSSSSTKDLHISYHGTDASFRSAIESLRWCLSPDNVTPDRPLIYSPKTIRSLYYRAESRNQLEMLDSNMLTLLMGLFGSLSIGPQLSILYKVPLASHFSEAFTGRTHWAFVLKIGRYKLASGMTLHDSDRFWLMRAELAIVQASSPLEPLSDDAYSAILRARVQYHVIRRHSRHPDVHVYYFETLLAIRDPRLLDHAASDLSFLLRTHRVCHPWLQRLLYRLVIQHGGSLSTRSQEAILAALWSRTHQGTDETSDVVSERGLDATTIARSVSATLFGFAGHFPNHNLANILAQLLPVFSTAYALPLRWSSLTLLSIFNSSEMLHLNETHWTSDRAMPQITSCWQVIFGLATIEKILQDPSSAFGTQASSTKEVLETSHTLCRLWLSIIKSCSISRDLSYAVATSFLRIASVLANATLFYGCQDLFPVGNPDGPQTSVPKLFATQYIAAAVRVQDPLPNVVFTALETLSADQRQQYQVLASAVEVLSPVDASLAYALYNVAAQAKGTQPDPGVIHALALSFARRGAIRQAVLFLNHSRLSPQARGILLSAIARSLRENPRVHHPPSVFAAIVDELAALYQSHIPPEHFRGHLEQLFVVLAQRGRGRKLLPVVLSILRRSPGLFQSRFFNRYFRELVRHRQLSAARRLLHAITAAHHKHSRSLSILSDRIAVKTKAFRAFRRTPPRGPALLKLSSLLRRSPHAGPPPERSLQELLSSGRVLAAKHFFARVATTIPSSRCTALGNILIHGVSRQPTPRNGRRVRKILALLENLVENHGFQPDRVTANILVKVMIHWRSAFDSPRLRELFDQLVRGGCPAADYSPLHPPFGTRHVHFSGATTFSKLPSFVSFEKHSRPLFKMFIKAFYSCNDVEAARRVVGILKVEEYKHATAREGRRNARSKGRIKAAQRNVTLPDPCIP